MPKNDWFCVTTLHDWLKKLAPLFIQSEVNQNESCLGRIRFPALCVNYVQFPRALIGSLYCLCPLWLARVITLVLVLRHTIENHSYSNFSFYFVREVHDCQVSTPEGGCRSGMFDVSSFSAALSSSGLVPADCSPWRWGGRGGARDHFSEQRLVIEPIFDYDRVYDRETKSNVSLRASNATTDSVTSQTEIQEIAMQQRYKVCLKIPDVERKWA